jgi:hypothetical protein
MSEAQELSGSSPITVRGTVEIADEGTIDLLGEGDDIEDLFKINIFSEVLTARLDSFTSDCDLYIFDEAFNDLIFSIARDAKEAEVFDDIVLAVGAYYVGVSIHDPEPLGDSTTSYILSLTGDFGAEIQDPVLLGYKIYRSISPNAMTTGEMIDSIGPEQNTYSDTAQTARDYYYQVTAIYDQGESPPSNDAMVIMTRMDEVIIDHPQGIMLHQSFPNPFITDATIEYFIPGEGNVKLTVYSITGKVIRQLVYKNQYRGHHKAVWNGLDDNGIRVPTGFYFYRLQWKNQTHSKTMIRVE